MKMIFQISLRGSLVCCRGFTCEAFCTGEIHSLFGDYFRSNFIAGEITGVGCTGALRQGCKEHYGLHLYVQIVIDKGFREIKDDSMGINLGQIKIPHLLYQEIKQL